MFVRSKPYRPSLMFASKARAYLSGTPVGLNYKNQTLFERLASNKLLPFGKL
jgi:hypothetical protein